MLVTVPNIPTKGLGLNTFSSSNKEILELNIKEALKKGLKAT